MSNADRKQYEYHFDFGGGAVGMTASVVATSEDEAVEMLRSHLEPYYTGLDLPVDARGPVQWSTVWVQPDKITVADIDQADEIDEEAA